SFCCFFFSSRRRHTRSTRDWSSDVCSSDLLLDAFQQLARKGYEIGLAENAQQLLKRVEQDGVDLVLLDIEMPEISGLDALKILRSEERRVGKECRFGCWRVDSELNGGDVVG